LASSIAVSSEKRGLREFSTEVIVVAARVAIFNLMPLSSNS
jgi:hypothetical protein